MAGVMKFDVHLVKKRVDELLKAELHITENDGRFKAWKTLEDDGTVEEELVDIIQIYQEVYDAERSNGYAKFTFVFFSRTRDIETSKLLTHECTIGIEEDAINIRNFLVHSVFVYGQNSDLPRSEDDATTTTTLEEKDQQQQAKDVLPETTRGLLSLGGGCLGEIWKVNKRRRTNESLSASQKELSQKFYDLTFAMRMTQKEKADKKIPIGIIIRDRGGLFIPKWIFLPFLRKTNNIVMKYATLEKYQQFGKGMLQACMAEVQNTVELWKVFRHACESINLQSDVKKPFFDEWLRKLSHARLAEFIRAHTQKKAAKEGRKSKGGQTLRDKLFALTETRCSVQLKKTRVAKEQTLHKGKQPLGIKVKGKGSAANQQKLNNSKQPLDKVKGKIPIKKTQTKQPDRDPIVSGCSRPVRERVRSRRLLDFTE